MESKAKGLEVDPENKSVVKMVAGRRVQVMAGERDRRSWGVSDCVSWCNELTTSSSPWQTLVKGLFKEQGYREAGSWPRESATCTRPGILGSTTPCTAGQTNHSSFCSNLDGPCDLHKNMLTALGNCLDELQPLYILPSQSLTYKFRAPSLQTWLHRRAVLF